MTLFPRFLAGLRLCSTDQLQQTASAAAKIDVVSGGESLPFGQKTIRIHRVENQFPLDLLLAGSRVEDIKEAHAEMLRTEQNYELLREGTRSEDIEEAEARHTHKLNRGRRSR